MSNDDIYERIVEGEPYEEAVATVRRLVPLSLEKKIGLSVVGLVYAGLLAPALFASRNTIEMLEETGSLTQTLSPALSTLVALGVVTTFGGGLLLVRQRAIINRGSLSVDDARRQVRIEDLLMIFVIQGVSFIIIPTTPAIAAAVSGEVAQTFYDNGVVLYQAGGAVRVDSRLVSPFGIVSAAVLAGLWWRTTR
jgi:hypothetical protein